MKRNATVAMLCLFAVLSLRAGALEAPPAFVHSGRAYFLQDDDNIVSIALDNPADMKRYPDRNDYSVAFVPVGGDVAVITDSGDTTLWVDGATGDVRWMREEREMQNFLGADGSLPVFGRAGNRELIIEVVDARTNEAVWEARLSSIFSAESAVVAHDHVFLLAMEHNWERGGIIAHLIAFDRGTGDQKWDVELGYKDENNLLLFQADGNVCLVATGFDAAKTVRTVRFWNAGGEDLSAQPAVPEGTALEDALSALHTAGGAASLHDRKSWYGVRYLYELRHTGRDMHGNPRRPVVSEDEFHTWTLRDGSVFLAPSIEQRTAWDAVGNPNPPRGGQRVQYRSADASVGWEGVPGYMNAGQANPVLWVAEDEEHIVFASRLGQVECLDRRTGASRWIYTYPAKDGTLEADGRWSIRWYNDPFTARLRRYAERAAGKGITGTTVVGETVTDHFRIVTLAEEFLPKRIREYSNNSEFPYMIDFRIGDGGLFSIVASFLMLVPLVALLLNYRAAGYGTTTKAEVAHICYLVGAFLLFVSVGGYSFYVLAVTGATFAATLVLFIRKKYMDGKLGTDPACPGMARLLLAVPYAILCLQLATNIPALIGSVVFMIAGALLGFHTFPV